jgi:hypothetical protein
MSRVKGIYTQKSENEIEKEELEKSINEKNEQLKKRVTIHKLPHILIYEEKELFNSKQMNVPIQNEFPLNSKKQKIINIIFQNNILYFKCGYTLYFNDDKHISSKNIFLFPLESYVRKYPHIFGYIILYYLNKSNKSQMEYMKLIYDMWIIELKNTHQYLFYI